MTGINRLRLYDELSETSQRTFGNDVIEQYGINATRNEVTVGVYVVVIRNRNEAISLLCGQQDVVRGCGTKRGDFSVGECIERSILRAVRRAYGQYLVEFVVRNGDRMFGA